MLLGLLASLLGTRTLQGAKCIASSNKCLTSSNKDATRNKKLLGAKGIATRSNDATICWLGSVWGMTSIPCRKAPEMDPEESPAKH